LPPASHPLVSRLKDEGACRHAALIEEGVECSLIACRINDSTILLAAVALPDKRYVKAVPEDCIPSTMWSCNALFYTPYGVYVYADTWHDVARRLKEKTERLMAQERICLEKTSE